MPNTPVMQTFTKGMNGDASPYVLDLSTLASVKNMLFERGLLISRPGLRVVAGGTGNKIPLQVALPPLSIVNGWRGLAALNTSGSPGSVKLIELSTSNNETPVSTPPVEKGSVLTYANGLSASLPNTHTLRILFSTVDSTYSYYILGCTDATTSNSVLVKHVLGDAAVTATAITVAGGVVIADAVIHLSRLIIIPIPNGGPAYVGLIAWSKIGDYTDWTHATAGSALLPEAYDSLTAVRVLGNVLVVLRLSGIHLGVPTGSTPPYAWKSISTNGIGCAFTASVAQFDNRIFFAGAHSIYTYDLSNVVNIGEGIVTELFNYVRTYNTTIQGWVVNSYKNGYRPQYHVMPTIFTNIAQTISGIPAPPHFVYDITEGVWSKHVYDNFATAGDLPVGFAANLGVRNVPYENNVQYVVPGFLHPGASQVQYALWDPSVACESVQSFSTGRMQLTDPTVEMGVIRVLVVAYSSGSAACTLKADSFVGNTTQSSTTNFSLASGWNRVWVNKVTVGQFFQFTVTIPANVYVEFRQLVVVLDAEPQELRV